MWLSMMGHQVKKKPTRGREGGLNALVVSAGGGSKPLKLPVTHDFGGAGKNFSFFILKKWKSKMQSIRLIMLN
jgi:hypothetical protein